MTMTTDTDDQTWWAPVTSGAGDCDRLRRGAAGGHVRADAAGRCGGPGSGIAGGGVVHRWFGGVHHRTGCRGHADVLEPVRSRGDRGAPPGRWVRRDVVRVDAGYRGDASYRVTFETFGGQRGEVRRDR